MWVISQDRCVNITNVGKYYYTSSSVLKNIELPGRLKTEQLDYAIDVNTILTDGGDQIASVMAETCNLDLDWLSYYQGYVLLGLNGGDPQHIGIVNIRVKTKLYREFQFTLKQTIFSSQFPLNINQVLSPPNLLQFPQTLPLTDSKGAFFFFG